MYMGHLVWRAAQLKINSYNDKIFTAVLHSQEARGSNMEEILYLSYYTPVQFHFYPLIIIPNGVNSEFKAT